MPKPPHDAVLAGMRAYLQTLHEWSAVDETIMKGLHYLPIEECMSRWGIPLREKKVRVPAGAGPRMFWSPPDGEKLLGMIQYEGVLVIATTGGVYIVCDGDRGLDHMLVEQLKPVDGTVLVEALNGERATNDMLRAENDKLRAQIAALARLLELPKSL